MKKTLIIASAALVALAFAAFRPADPESLAIGAKMPMPDYSMPTTYDKETTLAGMKQENGLLVIFSCNGCPFVVGAEGYGEGWEGRYADLKKTCDANKVGMILVNSNEGKRDKGDNLNDMKVRAREHGFWDIAYALDKDSKLADAFGARTTPHVYLFDKNLQLVYKGAIDDNNESAAAVKEPWLKNAIAAVAKGQKCEPADTRPIGCSIKRPVQ